ncbi:hypothetical protein PVK06_013074 [Gossypium arboreum]|uniref:Uncharacterized protein n=1 Tax=Gossypium arboreum TaxID=29729 RepID=A0ABR0QD58_GOSAR|nr:hypothetical protein PVK06_013074 [Gossypium arboreum]
MQQGSLRIWLDPILLLLQPGVHLNDDLVLVRTFNWQQGTALFWKIHQMKRRNRHVLRETHSVANDTDIRGAQNVKNSEDESLKGDQKSSLSNHGDQNTEVSLREDNVVPSSLEETGGRETAKEPSQPPKAVKEIDMSDKKNEPCDAAASKPAGELSEPANASENLETASSSPSR